MSRVSRAASVILIMQLVWSLSSCQTVAGRVFLPRKGLRPPEHRVKADRNVPVTMSDGVDLIANVYRPVGIEKTPAILVRVPFSRSYKNNLMGNVLGTFWASRGYAVVLQRSRGRHPSGGEFYPLLCERGDGIDTLHWLEHQPWYDGRLGMWGGSSFGYTQWAIADQRDPGPAAYMIQIASSEFREMFYRGGAFALESALYWALRSYRDWDKIPSVKTLDRGAWGWPLLEADNRAADDIPFFNDWAGHVHKDDYWTAIDGADRAASIAAPVHLIAGWFDPFLPAQLDDYVRIRTEAEAGVGSSSRLVIGPWAHARPVVLPGGMRGDNYRRAALAPSVAWYDTHVAEIAADARSTAPVRIFVMGENKWRDEWEWPLARTTFTEYFLSSRGHANTSAGDGELALSPSISAYAYDQFTYDPNDPVPMAGGAVLGPRAGTEPQKRVETRHDVLVYTTGPLDEQVEVTGPVHLILYVTTSAPNTDFTGKLVDVHPDGTAYNVCEGILRRSYAPTDQPVEIELELWPTSIVFLKGHRIRLQVSSSSFPRFDRNPNTGAYIPAETRPVTARQRVYHGGDTPSRLILPVIPRPRL
ncbi:MAG: X-Pro dipeptidyl-peptidase [Candidatus Hydrogenedentota bacterium]